MSAPTTQIWFLDTSSLLSMAVDPAIADEVLDEIGTDQVVIIDVVVDELKHRATIAKTATLAKTALASRPDSWNEIDTDQIPLELVAAAQEDVADGRVLTDDLQHWAEATIIAMGRQSAAAGSPTIKVLLSEDYDARRVASLVPGMEALSIHRLLHARVQQKRLSAQAAADLAAKLQSAHRGPDITADEFTDPTRRGLGSVGSP